MAGSEIKLSVPEDILAGGGEMGALMRSLDWSKTPLGIVSEWAQSLKTALSILLSSRYPMFIWWGKDYINLYNDAFIPILGTAKHPQFLGKSAKDCWAEIWDIVSPLADHVLTTGEPIWSEDLLLFITRNGYLEETYFTFSYSPLRDDRGISGIFCACSENTQRVISERRLRMLRELASYTLEAKTVEQACQTATNIFAKNLADLPFTLLYLVNVDETATLIGTSGVEGGLAISPQTVNLNSDIDLWELGQVYHHQQPAYLTDLPSRFSFTLGGAGDATTAAMVMPIPKSGQNKLAALLILGISPRLAYDNEYQGFFELVASNLTTAIANADAFETESRRAQAVTASLKQVLSTIRDGFVTFDRDWHYTFLNDRFAEIIGMSREEVIGRNLWEVFPDLVNTEVDYHLHQAMDQQIAVQYEYYYPTWKRWFDNRVYSIPGGIAVICAEITNRKQTQEQLHLYVDVVKNTQVGIVVWQLEDLNNPTSFRLLLANVAASEITHVDFQSLIGQTMAESFPNLLQTPLVEQYMNVVRTGQLLDIGEVHYDEDGVRDGFYTLKAFPLPNHCLGLAFENITIRKQLEIALRQSEERFRRMAETIQDVFWISNPMEGQLLYVSPTYEKIWGRSCKNLYINFNEWVEAIHPEDRERVRQIFYRQVLVGGYDEEYRVVRPDGSVRWVRDRGFPIQEQSGVPYRVAGIAEDITSRKITETALREREQELVRANRIKDEFLAVLSHELRTPLNPILGWAKLLRSGRLDPQITERALETIERNAKLQTQLIEDLLDVSKILQGKMLLKVAPVNLNNIIQAAIETVRLSAEVKNIQIQTVFTKEVGEIAGDEARLQQIIWNLLSNAIKFNITGGRVEVRLEQVGTNAQIQVKDTGKGIKSEFMPYIFDYFQQEDVTTTRQFGGLGLGLSIVRYLTELHGGTVQAESSGEGQVTTFTVRLPLISVSSQSQDIKQPENTLDLSGLQVLIVDDESDTRELTAFILKQFKAIITTVASAQEALSAIKKQKPDILLSDIGMPDMDGYILMQHLRALPPDQGGEIPAIALTAYAGDMNQQQALTAGFQLHISKPIEPEILVRAIVQLVQRN
jgi:PAS domain S-box-containing protein